ncbi:hypothetical protein O3G_MSEX007949 [Manduca sexta]|uniref:Uncharacterized protein n=1 Tax=Manduca sexta TaxID=7130 RepID=A0A921Z821_MANSE|nr:hypothetical protein O3G_MSEX007949 [Manduca sexta]
MSSVSSWVWGTLIIKTRLPFVVARFTVPSQSQQCGRLDAVQVHIQMSLALALTENLKRCLNKIAEGAWCVRYCVGRENCHSLIDKNMEEMIVWLRLFTIDIGFKFQCIVLILYFQLYI